MSDTYTGKPERTTPFPKGKYVVVDADQVSSLTASGAHIVQILPSKKLVVELAFRPICARCHRTTDVQRDAAGSVAYCRNCSTSSPIKVTSPIVLDTHSFLVMIEIDQVYAGMEQRYQYLVGQNDDQYKQINALRGEVAALRKEAAAANEQRTTAEERANRLERDLQAARADLNHA